MTFSPTIEELDRIMSDPIEFCSRLMIKVKKGEVVPFGTVMSEQQKKIITLICSGEHKRIAILKGRQQGISTAVRAACFYLTYISPLMFRSAVIGPISDVSRELLVMDNLFYDTLPPAIQRAVKKKRGEIAFTDTESYIRSFTADGRSQLRGYTLNTAHMSEFPIFRDPMNFLAAALPATQEGVIIIESTPSAYNDALHQIIRREKYEEEALGWKVEFLPWFEFPEYQTEPPEGFSPTQEELDLIEKYETLTIENIAWRRGKIAEYNGDVVKFRKEYPCDKEEAYSLSDDNYFSPWHFDNVEEIDTPAGTISQILEYDKRDKYVIGVDVAQGIEQDYSCATVVSRFTNSPVAFVYSNKLSVHDFGELVVSLAERYRAKIHYEQNNHGHAFAEVLRSLGHYQAVAFKTTAKSKLQLYSVLRKHLEENMIEFLDSHTYEEMKSLVKDPKGMAPKHPDGCHDDRVIAYAIGLNAVKDLPMPADNWDRMTRAHATVERQNSRPRNHSIKNNRMRRF